MHWPDSASHHLPKLSQPKENRAQNFAGLTLGKTGAIIMQTIQEG